MRFYRLKGVMAVMMIPRRGTGDTFAEEEDDTDSGEDG